MLTRALYDLADRLAEGQVDPAAAAAELRELTRFQPSAQCQQWTSPPLAILDETWKWWLVQDTSAGENRYRVVSDRHTPHASNMVEEIDLTHADPADVDALGRALIHVAARLQADRDDEED